MDKESLIESRIENSVVTVTQTVFPGRTNHHNTLFGGEALARMDEAAFISATRFCRKPLVTISSDKVDFKEAIPSGSIMEIVAKVSYVGSTSLKVKVTIYVESMLDDNKHKAISGQFTFVALDNDRKPTSVI